MCGPTVRTVARSCLFALLRANVILVYGQFIQAQALPAHRITFLGEGLVTKPQGRGELGHTQTTSECHRPYCPRASDICTGLT